jgi:hypothetical protein
MREDIKERWATRLEELDNDVQYKGRLRAGDKMCCLGVLCELAVEDGLNFPVEDKKLYYAYGKQRETAFPPTEVPLWAGYANEAQAFNVDTENGKRNLWELNDVDGLNFDEIAVKVREL